MYAVTVQYDNEDGLFRHDQPIRDTVGQWPGEETDSGQDLGTHPHHMPIAPMTDADVERFLSFLDRRGDDECWPWIGNCDPNDGRGHFSLHRKTFLAPRIACYLAWHVDPGDRLACHTRDCNNPNCCNPRHLYLGTRKDDARDRVATGRQGCGRRPAAKLNEAQVAEIRRRYANGSITQATLAGEYGVSVSAISLLLNYKTWADVPATSVTDTSASDVPTPHSITGKGLDDSDHNVAGGTSTPMVCGSDAVEYADVTAEPQVKADERSGFIALRRHDEQRAECRYDVAG
jgi:hypothetical protein